MAAGAVAASGGARWGGGLVVQMFVCKQAEARRARN